MDLLIHDLATALEREACDEAIEDESADDLCVTRPWASTNVATCRPLAGRHPYLPRQRAIRPLA